MSNELARTEPLMKIKKFTIKYCFQIAIFFLIVNGLISFLSVLLDPTSSKDVENRLWTPSYFELIRTSIWVTVPMSINLILDYQKYRNDLTKKNLLLSRFLLVMSLMVPGVIQLYLPYESNPTLAWDLLIGLVSTQSSFIIGSLFISMFRYEVIETRNNGKKYNIIRGSIRTLAFFVVIKIFSVFLQIAEQQLWLRFLIGFIVFSTCLHLAYVIKRLMSRLYFELEDGKFISSQSFSDFLHIMALIIYFSSTGIVFLVQIPKGYTMERTFNVMLISNFKMYCQIIYTIILTVIPIRVNLFQAQLESEKLLKKLNMIRYVSHEMRTPLNTTFLGLQCLDKQINDFLQFCASNQDQYQNCTHTCSADSSDTSTLTSVDRLVEMKDELKMVKNGCNVVLATLNDLLTADKLEDDKLTLDIGTLDPWDFLLEVAGSFTLAARDSNVSLNIECQNYELRWFEETPVFADRFKLSQVVRNLISNALKFTPPEGSVLVNLEIIDNESKATTEKSIRISVKDSGAGIKKENLNKLFQQYVQFDAAKLQQGKGSGLGLWISKKIIDLHGGTIGATSDGEGRGCTFFFTLPIGESRIEKENQTSLGSRKIHPIQKSNTDLFESISSKSAEKLKPSDQRSSIIVSFRSFLFGSSSQDYRNISSRTAQSVSLAASNYRPDVALSNKDIELGKTILETRFHRQKSEVSFFEGNVLKELSSHLEREEKRIKWDSGLRFLIVDDSLMNRKLTLRLLHNAGHRVDEMEDGQCFVNFLQRNYSVPLSTTDLEDDRYISTYDVVLMDDSMTCLCGPDATAKARELGYTGLIVGVTGNTFEDQINHFISCGANFVLQKPLDIKILKEKLEEL